MVRETCVQIPGRVIPKTLKMVLDTSLLNTQRYKVRIKGKVEQSRKRSSAPLTPWCSSYWKGSLLVALDYGRQLYLRLTMSNTFLALKHLVGTTCTTSLYYENTLLNIKTKALVVASLLSNKSAILPPLYSK